MKKKLIEANNLFKTYKSEGVETHAVRGVSFDVEGGDFLAIMGPSGSGKSTLMQILGFLDKQTEGQYFFEGQDAGKLNDDQRADIRNKKIGFVFQSFNLLARTTVFENVELPLLYDRRRTSSESNNKKIHGALKSVMLEHRVDYRSNQLSGGEKQRVAIARALVNGPDVIFADEPTGNLDSKSGTQIMKILQELNSQGKTIILVTHETYTAQHAKRIIQVIDGKIVKDVKVEKRKIAHEGEQLK